MNHIVALMRHLPVLNRMIKAAPDAQKIINDKINGNMGQTIGLPQFSCILHILSMLPYSFKESEIQHDIC